jgi:hypothetical protein
MDSLVNDFAAALFTSPEPPCLSLYEPTHRHHPDNQQDPIRFRNLVKTMEESLRQKYSTRDIRRYWSRFIRSRKRKASGITRSTDSLWWARPACSACTDSSGQCLSWASSPTASM